MVAAGDGLIHPLAWTILNVLACLASLILTIELVYASKVREEQPVASLYYLFWSLGTTLVWEVEVSLRLFSFCRKRRAGVPVGTVDLIVLVVEWGFAVLFAFYAFDLLLEWKHYELDDIDASFVQAGFSTIGYAIMSVITFLEYQKSKIDRQTFQESAVSSETSYQSIM